jgi:hypothetical protein
MDKKVGPIYKHDSSQTLWVHIRNFGSWMVLERWDAEFSSPIYVSPEFMKYYTLMESGVQ